MTDTEMPSGVGPEEHKLSLEGSGDRMIGFGNWTREHIKKTLKQT